MLVGTQSKALVLEAGALAGARDAPSGSIHSKHAQHKDVVCEIAKQRHITCAVSTQPFNSSFECESMTLPFQFFHAL